MRRRIVRGKTLLISTRKKMWNSKRNTTLHRERNIEEQGNAPLRNQWRIMKIEERIGSRMKNNGLIDHAIRIIVSLLMIAQRKCHLHSTIVKYHWGDDQVYFYLL